MRVRLERCVGGVVVVAKGDEAKGDDSLPAGPGEGVAGELAGEARTLDEGDGGGEDGLAGSFATDLFPSRARSEVAEGEPSS